MLQTRVSVNYHAHEREGPEPELDCINDGAFADKNMYTIRWYREGGDLCLMLDRPQLLNLTWKLLKFARINNLECELLDVESARRMCNKAQVSYQDD